MGQGQVGLGVKAVGSRDVDHSFQKFDGERERKKGCLFEKQCQGKVVLSQ